MSGYTQTIHEQGEGLDHTVTTVRKNIQYNNFGQIISYIDTITDSASPDKTTEYERYDIIYDELGRMTGYKEKTHETGESEVTNSETGEAIEIILDRTIENTRTDIQYNALGQIIGYTDTIIDSASPAMITTITMSDITYDEQGRMSGYTQTLHEEGECHAPEAPKVLNKMSEAENANGPENKPIRPDYNYPETIKINHTVTTVRENIEYNALGQIVGYTDTIKDSGSPALTTTSIMSDITYDEQGRMTGYVQTIHKEGKDGQNELDYDAATTTITRSNMQYNNLGQVISYTQAEKTSEDSYDYKMHNMRYDKYGRLISYDKNNTVNSTKDTVHIELTYNELGLVETQKETGKGGDGTYTSVTTFWYDEAGRVDISVTTTTTRERIFDEEEGKFVSKTSTTTTIKNYTYDQLGLVSSMSFTQYDHQTGEFRTGKDKDIKYNKDGTRKVERPHSRYQQQPYNNENQNRDPLEGAEVVGEAEVDVDENGQLVIAEETEEGFLEESLETNVTIQEEVNIEESKAEVYDNGYIKITLNNNKKEVVLVLDSKGNAVSADNVTDIPGSYKLEITKDAVIVKDGQGNVSAVNGIKLPEGAGVEFTEDIYGNTVANVSIGEEKITMYLSSGGEEYTNISIFGYNVHTSQDSIINFTEAGTIEILPPEVFVDLNRDGIEETPTKKIAFTAEGAMIYMLGQDEAGQLVWEQIKDKEGNPVIFKTNLDYNSAEVNQPTAVGYSFSINQDGKIGINTHTYIGEPVEYEGVTYGFDPTKNNLQDIANGDYWKVSFFSI